MKEQSYLHKPSGVSLYREIAQPHVETFREVFEDSKPYEHGKPAFAPRILRGSDCLTGKETETPIGPYCMWRDHYENSFSVSCADWVLSRLKERTISLENNSMFFEIISHDNGWSLVTCSHNLILGSVWIAYIRTNSIPVFVQTPEELGVEL